MTGLCARESKTDAAKLAYLRREFGALVALAEARFLFVRSKEKEGAPAKRVCGVCKAEVYVTHKGRYAALQGGGPNDSCCRIFPRRAPQTGARSLGYFRSRH